MSCLLQSKDLCIRTASDLVDKTLKSLNIIKDDKNEFQNIYISCVKQCGENEIDIEEERRGKRRKGTQTNNYSHEEVYQIKFQNVVSIFYDYINKRFDKNSIKPVIELSNCILTDDIKNIDLKLLKLYEKNSISKN